MTGINRKLLRSLEFRSLAGLALTIVCEAVAAAGLVTILSPWWPAAAAALAAAEVAFYLKWRQKRRTLDAIPEQHHPTDHDGWAFFQKWVSSSHYTVKVLALAELINCWFRDIPTSEIKRGNAEEIIARGYFYKTLGQLKAEGKGHLVEQIVCSIEQVYGHSFEEGETPGLQYLDHLSEPLKVTHRPLVFYLACECVALMKHCMLLAAGFKGHTYGAYTYYTYGLPTEWQAAHGQDASHDHLHPIIFLHGVGAGLLPYIPFLLRTTALGRPVLAVEYKHLSMRWTDFIPTAPEVARDMSAMFELHGIRKASMVAHSYGTMYVSCLLKLYPEQVHSACFIDPVCCCMWSGHLVSNFVYNPARSTTGLITWLIARDIHTATSISRNFFWTDVNMWPDEVPELAVVVLSGKDDLVPVAHVDAMLRHETNAVVMCNPRMSHADFLFSPSWQAKILAEFAEIVQTPTISPKSSNNLSSASLTILRQSGSLEDNSTSEQPKSHPQHNLMDLHHNGSCLETSGSSSTAGSSDILCSEAQLAQPVVCCVGNAVISEVSGSASSLTRRHGLAELGSTTSEASLVCNSTLLKA